MLFIEMLRRAITDLFALELLGTYRLHKNYIFSVITVIIYSCKKVRIGLIFLRYTYVSYMWYLLLNINVLTG